MLVNDDVTAILIDENCLYGTRFLGTTENLTWVWLLSRIVHVDSFIMTLMSHKRIVKLQGASIKRGGLLLMI